VYSNGSSPSKFSLSPAYPNPFNPSTIINFTIGSGGHVLLSIYDIKGREILRLVDESMAAGSHQINWDASSYASGIYFVGIHSNDKSLSQKLVLIK